jgi:hypothetical protein
MDVGRYRRQPTIQEQPFMACGRYGVKLTHMGHGQFVWQEKGRKFMWLIIFCSKTGLRLTGTFWERSPSASSYRAEMLGLCALHLFARALSEFYKIQVWEATLCCDNKRALEQSANTHRRIRPSAKCADKQRSLKAMKHTFKISNISSGTNCHLFSN